MFLDFMRVPVSAKTGTEIPHSVATTSSIARMRLAFVFNGILLFLFKTEKDCSAQKLEELSQVALKQIEDRKYDTEMLSEGVTTIFKFGIAFNGKEVKIAVN